MIVLEAVIFDMDGVIIDSHTVARNLLCQCANKFGCRLTPEEISTWGSLSSRQFWQRVKDQFGLTEELSVLVSSYDVEQEIRMYREIGPIPGVVELLVGLKSKGIKKALATSASKHRMQSVIELFDLARLFDVVVCDEDVRLSKPDPEIFLTAAGRLDVAPQNCVVIEDSRNGLIAAKKAGMCCIGFKGLPHVTEDLEEADEMIGSFDEMNRNRILRFFKGGVTDVDD